MADYRRLHRFSRPLNPRAVRLPVCVTRAQLGSIRRVTFLFSLPAEARVWGFSIRRLPARVPATVTEGNGTRLPAARRSPLTHARQDLRRHACWISFGVRLRRLFLVRGRNADVKLFCMVSPQNNINNVYPLRRFPSNRRFTRGLASPLPRSGSARPLANFPSAPQQRSFGFGKSVSAGRCLTSTPERKGTKLLGKVPPARVCKYARMQLRGTVTQRDGRKTSASRLGLFVRAFEKDRLAFGAVLQWHFTRWRSQIRSDVNGKDRRRPCYRDAAERYCHLAESSYTALISFPSFVLF